MMPKLVARLLGIGAYLAGAVLLAVFALVAYSSRKTFTGGLDATTSHVTWLSLGGVILGLVIVAHVLGRQLLLIGRKGDVPQPLGAR